MQQLEPMQPLEDEAAQPAPGCPGAFDDDAQDEQRADNIGAAQSALGLAYSTLEA